MKVYTKKGDKGTTGIIDFIVKDSGRYLSYKQLLKITTKLNLI